jgi:hypothetical protein
MLGFNHAFSTEFDRVSGRGDGWFGFNHAALWGLIIVLGLASGTGGGLGDFNCRVLPLQLGDRVEFRSWIIWGGVECGRHQASIVQKVSDNIKIMSPGTYTDHGVNFLLGLRTLAKVKFDNGRS